MTAQFWTLITASQGNPARLKALLANRPTEEVISFCKEFYQGLINLNMWEVWGAGYVMAGGMSDDGFHYFRSWILGKGQEVYETALAAPDDLGKFAVEGDEFDNEELEYVAIEVLEDRGVPDPREDFELSPDDHPRGVEWPEEEVDALYPKLAAQFE